MLTPVVSLLSLLTGDTVGVVRTQISHNSCHITPQTGVRVDWELDADSGRYLSARQFEEAGATVELRFSTWWASSQC